MVLQVMIGGFFICLNPVNCQNWSAGYADDTVLLAESQNDLQNLVTIIEEHSGKYGLLMNVKKTKVMVISKKEPPKAEIKVKGKSIEQIDQFVYLGQLITTDGRSDSEIKRRITIAKNAFSKYSQILTNKRKRVVEGKVEGKRGRGRKRQSWLANIQETSQLRLSVACEAALDREHWRRMTAHLGDGTAQR
ncbi:hypothetical protein EGW08_019414 [Elysia chlorotica]|uniref:Reverse transcriptase domain-containing protein n=1 Tax=Elysia chlorotica TaxID=188477 RepID=A0A3S0ZE04_ELYCH|nr:hypothetical protein EGW08_019414 [Elysia chlorotica]